MLALGHDEHDYDSRDAQNRDLRCLHFRFGLRALGALMASLRMWDSMATKASLAGVRWFFSATRARFLITSGFASLVVIRGMGAL